MSSRVTDLIAAAGIERWQGTMLVPVSALVMLVLLLIARGVRRRSREVHKRGVLLRQARGTRRGQSSAAPRVTLAGIAIPAADESKHFKIIGSTGTGKSTAIAELLRGALARGDRAVIADPDGGYTSLFHRRHRGDVILNPFEPDSCAWDVFAEMECDTDVEHVTRALIPDCEDAGAREWRSYARTFVAAVLRGYRSRASALAGAPSVLAGAPSVLELWRLLLIAPAEELRPLISGTPAQPFLDPDNARMFGSIRSIAGAALSALDVMRRHRARPCGVRRWVRDADGGSLFIPYRAGQIAALRGVIATWLRLAIFEAMNQPAGQDLRLWFVIDELDALGAVDGLKDALARLRKFGGRCVIGLQSIAQVSSTYGGGDAQTIIENCANTLILRCAGSENGGTSTFVSKLIGEREVVRRQVSHGKDRDAAWATRGGRRSTTISEQRVIEAALLPSQIEQLPDLHGYFKGASARAWYAVSFPYPNPKRRSR